MSSPDSKRFSLLDRAHLNHLQPARRLFFI
jgi:hypothetical protein